MDKKVTVQVKSRHFCAGLVIVPRGKCVEAAPIVRYMKGWTGEKIRTYCRERGWLVAQV